MWFNAAFYLVCASIAFFLAFVCLFGRLSMVRSRPSIDASHDKEASSPASFADSLDAQLFRVFGVVTLLAILAGSIGSFASGDTTMAGLGISLALVQALCFGSWELYPHRVTIRMCGSVHAFANCVVTVVGGLMNGVPFSFVWSCSVAPFWCSFYTVTCGPLVGVLYFLGLLVGSLVLPEMGIVASGQLETCRLGVSIQTTILGFFLSLAILRQSKLRIEYTEKGFQLLSSQKDAFIRTVSHEIRTPLQGLVSSAELLGAERLPQSARMYVETISHCSSTLKLLIENVLGAGPSNLLLPQPSEVEISELVRKVEKYGEALALSKPWISVKVFSHVQAKALLLPETPLLQILLNFIANAVKFSLADSRRVDVSLEMTNATTLICRVVDEGKGVREEFRDRLFQVYQRDSLDVDGTGLGLSICRKLADTLGGAVGYEPRGGGSRGSVFYVSIPVKIAGMVHARHSYSSPRLRRNRQEGSVPTPSSVGPDFEVVVIDDNSVNEKVLSRMLSVLGCKNVVVCPDALSGLQHLLDRIRRGADNVPCLVLMDESMPVLRGTAACEVWRAAERAAGVRRRARICLASAGAAPVSQHYDQFLLKPLALADLKRELAKLLA